MRQRPTNYTPSMLEHGMVPPHATDLEEAVLGALMLENDAISDVMDVVRPESFYRIEHQKIFHAIVSLTEAGKPADILTVTHFLKQEGTLDLVGGAYFLSQLTDRVSGSANAEFHARIIQQKFIARELIRVSGEIYHKAFDDTTDVLELLDEANLTVADIGSDINSEKGSKSNMELVNEVISDAERASQGNSIIGIPTEIPDVDKLTGGWEGGKVYILAGRPGMGKTAKALQDAYYMTVVLKLPTLFFSLEMPAKELMLRIVSKHLDIDANLIKAGKLTTEQWSAFNSSMQQIIDSPLEIVDHLYSLMDIRKKILIHKKRNGLGGVFVDYLQLMKHKEAGKNREQEVSEISRMMKQTAKEVDCPFIVLAQLSRSVETRGGSKRPMLSDLRESGSIEQDADQVHFMYRPEYYGIETDEEYGDTHGLAELIVAKNRGGATGTAPMRFHPKTTSFSPWGQSSFSGPNPNDIPDTPRSAAMKPSREFGIDDIDNGDDNFDYF
jgi:replicative DNA helicase